MKSSFCIDLQRFMLIPTKFPLTPLLKVHIWRNMLLEWYGSETVPPTVWEIKKYINKKIPAASPKRKPRGNTPVGVDGFEPPTLCL